MADLEIFKKVSFLRVESKNKRSQQSILALQYTYSEAEYTCQHSEPPSIPPVHSFGVCIFSKGFP